MDNSTFGNKNEQTYPNKQENNAQRKLHNTYRCACVLFGIKNEGGICSKNNQKKQYIQGPNVNKIYFQYGENKNN